MADIEDASDAAVAVDDSGDAELKEETKLEPKPPKRKAKEVQLVDAPDEEPAGEKAKQKEVEEDSDFSEALVDHAESLGLDPDDFPTPAALSRAVGKIDLRLAEIGRKALEAESVVEEEEEVESDEPPVVSKRREEAEQLSDEFDEALEGLDDEITPEFKEKLQGKLKQLYQAAKSATSREFSALKKQLEAMQSTLQQQQESTQQVEFARITKMFDDGFAALGQELGEDFVKVIGEGGIDELRPREAEARKKIAKHMDYLQAGYIHDGAQVPDFETLLRRAVNMLHGDVIKTSTQKAMRTQAQNGRRSRLHKPAARGKPASGRERALEEAESRFPSPDAEGPVFV